MALSGHVCPATAYIVHNYPFGSGLRCIMRVWVQTTKSGMRVMHQTTTKAWNREYTSKLSEGEQLTPPPGGEIVTKGDGDWNKPKSSVYADLRVMYLDDVGHVQSLALSFTSWPKHFADFDRVVGELPGELAEVRKSVERISRSYSRKSWEEFDKELKEKQCLV